MFKHKNKLIILVLGIVMFLPATARAAVEIDCPDGYKTTVAQPTEENIQKACADHQTGDATNDETEAVENGQDRLNLPKEEKRFQCGKGDKAVKVNFNFGCVGEAWGAGDPDAELNPIVDLTFAVIRILSTLVGIGIIIMVIVAGIQYSAAQGNPQATAAAIAKVRNAIIGLAVYLLIFSLLQWLVPGGIFN